MIIGGLQKVSLSDYPGKIAAIVFCRGCNFRCPYCHNPELVDPARYGTAISQDVVLRHLWSRRAMLQGVVVTGGEPTVQVDLPSFLHAVRDLGLAARIDTNGSHPELLGRLIRDGLVNCVAMDIKAPAGSYGRITATRVDPALIVESLRIVLSSGIDHEIRTTYSERFLSLEELREIAVMVRGCGTFALQGFRPSKALDSAVMAEPATTPEQMERARLIFQSAGIPALVR